MRHVRRLVYRLGFRPKHPSILFSPTLHVRYVLFEAATEGLRKGLSGE